MARPTGRYFASVIAKIQDAHAQEQIVVDHDFKLHLRNQLMIKIAAQVSPVRRSWTERFAPFKMYFAAVPALALVVVAVVGLSKVQIWNKVVAPQAVEMAQDVAVDVPVVTMIPQENVESSIRTFPGSNVLPANYFQANVIALQAVQQVPTAGKVQPASKAQKSNVVTPLPRIAEDQYPPAYVRGSMPPMIVYLPPQMQYPQQYPQGNPLPAVVNPVPSQVMPNPTPLPVTPLASQIVPQVIPTSLPIAPTPSLMPPLNDMAVLPPQELYATVLYSGNFSNDERTILEKNLLPRLVEGKTVNYINVSQGDAATIVVELNYVGGQVDTYHYKLADSISNVTSIVDPALMQSNVLRMARPIRPTR